MKRYLTTCWLCILCIPVFGQSDRLTLVARARVSAVYDIEAVPPHAYALEAGILRVLDVSDLAAVREVGALEFEQPRSRLAVYRSYLYLTGFGQPMGVVDISDPSHPRWVGELADFDGTVNDAFELAGDFAYVVRRAAGDTSTAEGVPLLFDVLDLGNPARPRRLGSLELGVRVRTLQTGGIAHADGHAFVLVEGAWWAGESRTRLVIVDTRVPDKPWIERTLLLAEDRQFRDVEVRGDLLFLLQWRPASGLAVYRMHPQGDPELLGEATDPKLWGPVDLILHGDVIYATFKGGGPHLVAFDVSNLHRPRLVYTYTIFGAGLGMTLVEHRLYVTGDQGPTPIFDVSQPRAPRLLGQWDFQGGSVRDVVREGRLAILTIGGTGILVYDVADPRAPRRMGRYTAVPDIRSWQSSVTAAVDGSRVFVAYDTIPAEVLDISDPTQPVVLGRIMPRGLVRAIALAPSHAFLGYRDASDAGGIEVVDLANPRAPRAVAVLDLGRAVTDLALHRRRLLAAHPDGGLTIVDIRDPTQPVVLRHHPGSASTTSSRPNLAMRVALSDDGNQAYIARCYRSTGEDPYVGGGTLSVVDLRDQTSLRVLGQLEFESRNIMGLSIAARGNHVVIFTGDILMVDASNPARPTVMLRQSLRPGGLWVGGLAIDDEYLYVGAGEDGLWIYRLPHARR